MKAISISVLLLLVAAAWGGAAGQKAEQSGVTWDKTTLRPFATHTGQFYRYAPSVIAEGPRDWCWACPRLAGSP
ncbi:MAG: hypothetical protein M3Y13_02630 [Armatimonadota bacterium]|nr:hypothetical protein [Armatimonadota bacterium]